MAILARRSVSSLETMLAPGGGPRAASSAYPLFPSLSLPRTPAETVDGSTRKARHTTPFSIKPGGSSIQDAAARPMAPEAPRRPCARRAGPGQPQPQPQGTSRVVLSGSLLAGRSSSGDSIVEDEGLLAAIRAVSTGEAGVPEAHSRQRLPCIATAGFTSAVGVAAPLFRLGQRALSQDNR